MEKGLKKDIMGQWKFTVNDEKFTADPWDEKTTCGHHRPDQQVSKVMKRVESIDESFEYKFDHSSEITLELSDPNVVYKLDKEGNQIEEGRWTMIYDEGFLIYLNGHEYFAFSRYNQDELESFKPDCSRTMVGWVHKEGELENWSCYFGEKIGSKNSDSQSIKVDEMAHVVSPTTADISTQGFLQVETQAQDIKYEELSKVVDQINNDHQATWKASLNPKFMGLSLAEVSQQMGIKRKDLIHPQVALELRMPVKNHKKQFSHQQSFIQSQGKGQQDPLKYWDYDIEDMKEDDLPKEWDWRDVNGVNYLPDVMNQGGCGSCYTISTVTTIESRIAIMKGGIERPKLSRQQLLNCNFYTEGCDGGYPMLVGKYAKEFGLQYDKDFPYEAFTEEGNCVHKEGLQTDLPDKARYGVEDHYYIGGYYGNSSELSMMKEIRARGPIVGNFEPLMTFSVYDSGIYESKKGEETEFAFAQISEGEHASSLTNNTLSDYRKQWERVDHSIVIVGWGEEDGQKFWICMNSWGEDWGEDGYFRFARGTDDSAMESMPSAYIPKIIE